MILKKTPLFNNNVFINFFLKVKERWGYLLCGFVLTAFFAFIFNKTDNFPLIFYGFLFIGLSVIVLSVGPKIHKNAFLIIIVMGTFFSFTTPVLDVPDEGTHLARSLYILGGNLDMTENNSDIWVSKDFKFYANQFGENIYNNNLNEYKHDESVVNDPVVKAANAYSFISYIPQTLGLLIGKILNLDLFATFYLGRIFNLLAYATLVYFGVKIIPEFKIPLLIVAIMPMSLYISASYNQDSTSLGLTFLAIASFLSIVLSQNVKVKKVLFFTVTCSALVLTKLPYALFSILILFIPPSKYIKRKYYWVGVGFCGIIMFLALIWFLYYSSFTPPHTPSGVNSKEQIIYIFSNLPVSLLQLSKNFFSFANYANMLFLFGWGSYGSFELAILYMFFLGGVFTGNSVKLKIPAISRFGTIVVFFLTYITICLSMYLTWTPVGSNIISGVQGRYFIGIIALLPFICSKNNTFELEKNIDKNNFISIFIGLMFIVAVLCLTWGNYY